MNDGKAFSPCRCTGGGNDKTIVGQIMLRFRPIAPKPVTVGSISGDPTPENIKGGVTKGRAKRKYVRAKKNNNKSRRNEVKLDRTTKMTLQLLPEFPYRRGRSDRDSDLSVYRPAGEERQQPVWLGFSGFRENSTNVGLFAPDQPDPTAMESSVTVESVTDVYVAGEGLGRTDVERIRDLEVDTCPGFVSGVDNTVTWINLAYREMTCPKVGVSEVGSPPSTTVRLVVKGELPIVEYRAFACRVRVQYTWRGEKRSQILPCDVWRMDFGGLAWRLDLDAALSLGR